MNKKRSDWWAEDPNVKQIINEAREEGMKQGKHELIGRIALMPKIKFTTNNREEDEYIEHILTQARNSIFSQIFDITLKQIEIEAKNYSKKYIESKKKCCECKNNKEELCRRICPINCPDYKKPCGR